ncbi:hypothetical protein LOAG_11204 [Loa loa]|uniref:Uncharacterized protein n=1 Tax=Loa loa TaxID=7209 RepID=A0A1S0TNC4_LOALO|nr:hypothetical protein LOAG_11204 [Loa loa]EFO17296.1 hypothetical protein LOAG_11204 [Loa loa]
MGFSVDLVRVKLKLPIKIPPGKSKREASRLCRPLLPYQNLIKISRLPAPRDYLPVIGTTLETIGIFSVIPQLEHEPTGLQQHGSYCENSSLTNSGEMQVGMIRSYLFCLFLGVFVQVTRTKDNLSYSE